MRDAPTPADAMGAEPTAIDESQAAAEGATASKAPSADAQHEASSTTCILAGLICGLLMYVFCCVSSLMIYGADPMLKWAIPLGVGTQTLTATLGGFIFAHRSGCRAIIAGPDITPTVFLAEGARAIVAALCPEGVDASCEQGERAVPTILMACAISTLLVGASFYLLGRFRLTEIVGYFPANVVSGFLACIGYKVLKASIEVAAPVGSKKALKLKYVQYFFGSWDASWVFIVPALPIGLLLYLLKRHHIGKPTVYFPVRALGPTAVFGACVFPSSLAGAHALPILPCRCSRWGRRPSSTRASSARGSRWPTRRRLAGCSTPPRATTSGPRGSRYAHAHARAHAHVSCTCRVMHMPCTCHALSVGCWPARGSSSTAASATGASTGRRWGRPSPRGWCVIS